MVNKLFKPGTIVTCREDVENLTVWSSYHANAENDAGQIDARTLMMIINSRKTSKKELKDFKKRLAKEWEIGAYEVLSSTGVKGWLGAGWVVEVL